MFQSELFPKDFIYLFSIERRCTNKWQLQKIDQGKLITTFMIKTVSNYIYT